VWRGSAFGRSAACKRHMKYVEIRPWRQSPFVVGKSYRVCKDFKCLRDSFRAGEVLIYDSDAYSRYDSYTGYFFSQPGAKQLRAWDLHDDEQLEIWRDLFEEI
jgi:hypothetical protein